MNLTVTQAQKALGILSRRLEAVAKDEALAGLAKSAEVSTREKEFVDLFIEKAPEILRMDEEELPARNRAVLLTALRLYVKNARAAAGTVLALGRDEWAEDLKAEADRLEGQVLPVLEEQRSLPVGSGA